MSSRLANSPRHALTHKRAWRELPRPENKVSGKPTNTRPSLRSRVFFVVCRSGGGGFGSGVTRTSICGSAFVLRHAQAAGRKSRRGLDHAFVGNFLTQAHPITAQGGGKYHREHCAHGGRRSKSEKWRSLPSAATTSSKRANNRPKAALICAGASGLSSSYWCADITAGRSSRSTTVRRHAQSSPCRKSRYHS
jgi:hypothetical protein